VRWRRGKALAALVLIAAATWWPSLDNGYSLDDYNWLASARFQSARAFVSSTDGVQLWTPVASAVFWAVDRASGGRPLAFRVVIFAFHLVAAFFVLHLARRLGLEDEAALAAAAIFVAWPAGSEALFWIAAFQHVVATAFGLGAILAWTVAHQDGDPRARVCAVVLLGLAILAKAPYASLLLAVVAVSFYAPSGRGDAGRIGPGLVPPALAAVVAAVAASVRPMAGSYLVDRGTYAFGSHILSNAFHYAERIVLPFSDLFARVGFAGLCEPIAVALLLVGAGAAFGAWGRGPGAVRVGLVLSLAAMAPFLEFTSAPASRYAYAASAGFAILLAWFLIGGNTRARVRRVAGQFAFGALLLASSFEIRLEDNVYEYRERQSDQWIDDVHAAFPALPRSARLFAAGLPRIAVDTEIHLEAALRLAYEDPTLTLVAGLHADHRAAYDAVLVYVDGHLRASRGP
jgi:hypothetical protein